MLGEIEWLYSRIVGRCLAMAMSETGHSRRFGGRPTTSGTPRLADILRAARHVSNVPQTDVAVAHTSLPRLPWLGRQPSHGRDSAPVIFSERDWNGGGLVHFAVLYPSDNPADVVR
jgi:hypothetical protein